MGVLICGTGIGMSLSANRHPSVRAALCHDAFTAEMARRHNDADLERALTALDMYERLGEMVRSLNGGHRRRVEKIEIERED